MMLINVYFSMLYSELVRVYITIFYLKTKEDLFELLGGICYEIEKVKCKANRKG